MAAGEYDLLIEQGATFRFAVTLTHNDATNTLYDLTGYSARAQVRSKHADANPAATLTCVVDVPTAKITVSLTPAQTAALGKGSYVWDLEVYTAADADVIRVLQGKAEVSPEATK